MGRRVPLLAGELLGLGAPPDGHQAEVVQAVVHGDGVDVDHLEAGGDAASVLLPVERHARGETGGGQTRTLGHTEGFTTVSVNITICL